MSDIYPPPVQREALLKFAEAVGCRDNVLRRDKCGDWNIAGLRGHVYAIPGSLDEPHRPGFQLFVAFNSERGWTFAKRALAFAKLTNDGNDEGSFFLDRLPTAFEAEVIRHYCGLDKKREVSEAELERLRGMSREHSFARRPIVVREIEAISLASGTVAHI